jgi:hypothetical protein
LSCCHDYCLVLIHSQLKMAIAKIPPLNFHNPLT